MVRVVSFTLTLWEAALGTQCIGGWVDRRAGLDFRPLAGTNSGRPPGSLVVILTELSRLRPCFKHTLVHFHIEFMVSVSHSIVSDSEGHTVAQFR
jgi:hypothetical protein